MAALPLGIHPAFAPWHLAGMRHLYLDDAALAALREEQARAAVEHDAARPEGAHGRFGRPAAGSGHAGMPAENAQRAPHRPPSSTQSPDGQARRAAADTAIHDDSGQTPASSPTAQQGSRPVRPRRDGADRAVPPATPPVASATVDLGVEASTAPLEQWPVAWRDLLSRTAPGAPLLWTYWALGDDLCGRPDAQRRQLLRHILGALSMPRGTHSFWPVALPDPAPDADGALKADAPLFHAGLQRLAPRCVLLMGSRALKTAAPGLALRPFQQVHHRGRLFIVLPDMDMLLQDPARAEALIAYLRPTLGPFGRR